MNGYLVLLQHTMDDIPVNLCRTKAEARRFARSLDAIPTEAVRNALGMIECSSPVVVSIVQFSGGVPISSENIKYFDESDTPPESRVATLPINRSPRGGEAGKESRD